MFKFEDLFKKFMPPEQHAPFSVIIDAEKNLIIEPYLPTLMRVASNDNTGVK